MITSISRRTDISAFYSDWFYNRLDEGEVLTVNPFNRKQVSRTKLDPDMVDCFVFWTKNPKNFMRRIHEHENYNYYFQFTLNSYSKDLKPSVPEKKKLINTFKELSNIVGRKKLYGDMTLLF
ncbi:DUF1848 family protein [Mycoplasmatota bacterium WC44]